MSDNTWQKAKELFHAARSLPADERATFLDDQCLNDPELREQVDEFLAFYDSEFMESPPLMNAAKLLENENFAPGRTIGRYIIREVIGTGGMGQVFLADDTELNRPVAFKVLHEDVAGDQERVRRFIQEARAASALNHPNILTIYEIGTFETARFIVSEYVDGDTLRERMQSGLTTPESLEITCQIAAALQAAHAAGIVHRDIKPENIMLRQDGLVKVLDFGLAKLTEAEELRNVDRGIRNDENDSPLRYFSDSPQSAIRNPHLTAPGLIMGTVAYMSPEQARGQAVDSRTDLWSLGVVFHEMLTGESPFKGESVTDLVTSIVKFDPASLDLNSISQELKPICTKALAKDKKARYQSASDLLQDLQGEKKRMEYAIQGKPYVTVSSTDELKTQLIRRRPTLSAEYIVTGMKRHKYATVSAVLSIVIAVIGLAAYRYNGATPVNPNSGFGLIDSSTSEEDLKFSRLPISGLIGEIVISPDGKYVGYGDWPPQSFKILERETLAEVALPEPGWSVSFSSDSKFVYYAHGKTPYGTEGVKRMPVSGGPAVKVVDNVEDGVSFSPDGSTMAFTRKSADESEGELIMLANPDGSNERVIGKASPDNNVFGTPIFSPDGKTLAIPALFKEKPQYTKMLGFSVADGEQRPISETKWNLIYSGAAWLPNGNLIITGKRLASEPMQVWAIPPSGEPKAITSGLDTYQGVSATRAGDILVTTQVKGDRSLVMLPGNDVSKAKPIITSGEIDGRFTFAPDGRIVYCSTVTGDLEVWIMNPDGSGRKQLTRDPATDGQVAISSDGRYIVFISNRINGLNHIFRIDADGSNTKQLTNGGNEILPSFSSDGKWVYFIEGPEETSRFIRKVSVNGGESTLVATAPDGWTLNALDVNRADGRIAYGLQKRSSSGWESQYKVGIVPAQGGTSKLIDVPANFNSVRSRWTPDNKTIAIRSVGTGMNPTLDVWSLSVDGQGKRQQLTDFRTPSTYGFSWSFDGKQLLVARGTVLREPVIIRSARN